MPLFQRSTNLRIGFVALLGVLAAGGLALGLAGDGRWSRVSEIFRGEGLSGLYLRMRSAMGAEGLSVSVLEGVSPTGSMSADSLVDGLRRSGTNAIIVRRGEETLLEAYAPDWGPDRPHGLAAMGKAATASVIAMAMVDDGYIDLDDPAAEYVPGLRADSARSRITLRQLLTHSSGLDDVDFTKAHTGWKARYLANPADRHAMAVSDVPLIFPPGSDTRYSGIGFYVLAGALAHALEQAEGNRGDLNQYLRDRIMARIGAPPGSWRISYGQSYDAGPVRLYAIGSGGSYSPRLLDRIARMLLDHGQWRGTPVIDSAVVREFLTFEGDPQARPNRDLPAMAVGFWSNCGGFWPSLPDDATLGLGNDQQVFLLVPSLSLSVVRLGDYMGSPDDPRDDWQILEDELFSPIARTFGLSAEAGIPQETCR